VSTFLDALLPVFVLIVVGYAFQYYAFPSSEFWGLAARITYFAFFPALLVNRLATAELADVQFGALVLAASGPVLLVSGLLLGLRRMLPVSGAGFTSIFQGSIRFNTYVGLAVVGALLGDQGVALAAVVLAFLVPLVNVLSVGVLTHYAAHTAADWRGILLSLAQNPLILACLLGIALNLLGIGLPLGSGAVLEIFSSAALPMGLLTVGAGLNVRAARASLLLVGISSGLKLLLLPALTLIACHLLGLSAMATTVVVVFAALPTATSAYILAQELGGDMPLMAAILTVQTVLAVLTMSLVSVFI
jgi:hypothetical protein